MGEVLPLFSGEREGISSHATGTSMLAGRPCTQPVDDAEGR
jgi:hypothetical protein